MSWNKAQPEGKDPKHSLRSWGQLWPVLFKGCNAVPGYLGRSLRARREAVIRFVAPFDKDWAIACKARRATNHFTSRRIHHTYVVRPLGFIRRQNIKHFQTECRSGQSCNFCMIVRWCNFYQVHTNQIQTNQAANYFKRPI